MSRDTMEVVFAVGCLLLAAWSFHAPFSSDGPAGRGVGRKRILPTLLGIVLLWPMAIALALMGAWWIAFATDQVSERRPLVYLSYFIVAWTCVTFAVVGREMRKPPIDDTGGTDADDASPSPQQGHLPGPALDP